MKLICEKYGFSAELQENQILVWTIENPTVFSDVVLSFWQQVNGGEGNLLLSGKLESLSISKKTDLIVNPFAVNINNKKILTALYKELSAISINELQDQTGNLNSTVISYLDNLCSMVPYPLEFDLELETVGLLKAMDVKVDDHPESLLEKLESYVKAMHQICKIPVFIFVNLKQYLTEEECLEYYKYCMYEKVQIILLEGVYSPLIGGEKRWVLDKDLCMIEAN